MELNFLIANLAVDPAKVRTEVFEGRSYWVAPLSLITEGVHGGSLGAVFYAANEIKKSAPAWNLKPIVVEHPRDDAGNFISAASTRVLEKQQIGFVLNARFEKKLRSEAWLDQEKTKRVSPRIAEAIAANEILEVSTGLFYDKTGEPGEWNGEKYDYIAVNHRPDHLAILLTTRGACSIADGAGLLQVNTAGEQPLARLISNERSHSQLYDSLAKALRQLRGDMVYVYEVYNKYLVFSQDGVLFKMGYTNTKDAVTLDTSSTQRVEEDKTFKSVTVTANSKTPARDKFAMKKRNEAVTELIANSAYSEADREWLTALDDEKFQGISVNTRRISGETVVAPVAPPVAPTAPVAPVANSAPVTLQSYVDTAPEAFRAELQEALVTANQTRQTLVTAITANQANPFPPEALATMPLQTLRGLAALATPVQPAAPATPAPYNYAGQAPVANQNGQRPAVTPLESPVMSWGTK